MSNNSQKQNSTTKDSLIKEGHIISQPSDRIGKIRHWLGLEHNIIVMLLTILILGMGEELWTRFIPKYLEVLGASALIIAFYGTLKDLLDALYQYPGGWLADRLGRRMALILFTLLAVIGYIFYLLTQNWIWVIVGTIFVMAWSSLTLPAIFAIIGDNLPKTKRSIGFGVQSILKRVPIVLAPPIGGLLIFSYGISKGIRLGLIITIILAFIAIAIVLLYYKEKKPDVPDKMKFIDIWKNMDSHLKRLLAADCLARWAEGIPKVFIILYVMNILKVTSFQFGWLTSIQMLSAIIIYIPIAKLSDRMNRKPFVLITFVFFAFFPFMLVNAQGFFFIVLAFVIAGLREIGEPARKALIVDLADEKIRGRMVGMYYLIRGLVVFPASLVGGWLWKINPQFPFYIAFFIGILSALTYALWGPGDEALAK